MDRRRRRRRRVGPVGARSTAGLVAAALAGTEHVATLVLRRDEPLDLAGRRTLERGALVTALVLLFARSVTDAEERLGGQLLVDLLEADAAARATGCASAYDAQREPRRPARGGRGEHRRRRPAPRRRAAVALARRMSGLAGEHRGAVVLGGAGRRTPRAGRRATSRRAVAAVGGRATVGVAATSDARPRGPAGRRARRGAALPRHPAPRWGARGEVSDPAGLGVARLLLGDNDPEHVDGLRRGDGRPVREWDARRGTGLVATLEAWFASRRSPQGDRRGAARPPQHGRPSGSSGSASSSGAGWRDPARSLDLQLALRLVRLRDD